MRRLLWVLPVIAALGAFALVSEGVGNQAHAEPTARVSARAPQAHQWLSDDPRSRTGETGIVMIAADWCGYCQKLRRQFDAARVPYQVLDVDTLEGQRALLATGARGVPVTLIGQFMVQGYDTAALDEQLKPLGYRVF